MKSLLLVLCLIFPSCLATSGDLESIAAKMAEGEQRIAAKQADFAAGLASAEEVTEAISDAWGGNIREVEAVAEKVKERGSQTLEQMLGIALAVTGVGGVGLNQWRNRTRATDPRIANSKGGGAA